MLAFIYKDDGLSVFRNLLGPETERERKVAV